MARRRSPLKKALRAMAPQRVLWRAVSGPEFMRGMRQAFGTRTVRVTGQTRRKQVAAAQKKTAAAAKKAAKRADPYADARKIPAANRAVAARQAKTAQPAKRTASARASKVGAGVVPVRNPDGTFNGSKSLSTFGPSEQAANTRAWQGYVDPAMLPRNSRTRKRP